jgi:hypothetical protein
MARSAQAAGWALSLASHSKSWTSAVMAYNENPDYVAYDTEQKMIREPAQVHSADVTLSNRKGCGLLRSVGKFWTRHLLVILRDLVDIRVNLRMKDEPHQLRRRSIC